MKKIGIVGAGINGLFISWVLSKNGFNIDLYDSGRALSKTSSSSSKLLHGGIRYLEQGHFSLVREAMIDRHWWINNMPEFANPIKMIMPAYESSRRSTLLLYSGAFLYRIIAGKYSLGPTKWIRKKKLEEVSPELNHSKLRGGISYFDAQMHEESLGLSVKNSAIESGVNIMEHSKVDRVSTNGILTRSEFGEKEYDLIINAAGPWASDLLTKSKIDSNYSLSLIRGSHLYIDRKVSNPYILQVKDSKRIIFVLPYFGETLLGTTEVPHQLSLPVKCSEEEQFELFQCYNDHFKDEIDSSNVTNQISGLRAIVSKKVRNNDYSSASRESEIEYNDKLVNIFGGKWTTAPSLSMELLRGLKNYRNLL